MLLIFFIHAIGDECVGASMNLEYVGVDL